MTWGFLHLATPEKFLLDVSQTKSYNSFPRSQREKTGARVENWLQVGCGVGYAVFAVLYFKRAYPDQRFWMLARSFGLTLAVFSFGFCGLGLAALVINRGGFGAALAVIASFYPLVFLYIGVRDGIMNTYQAWHSWRGNRQPALVLPAPVGLL